MHIQIHMHHAAVDLRGVYCLKKIRIKVEAVCGVISLQCLQIYLHGL